MQRTIRNVALIALALLLVGCNRIALSPPNIVIGMISLPGSPVVGSSTITVFVRALDGQPIPGAVVWVEGTHIDPNLAPVKVWTSEAAPGTYRARMIWPSAGNWFVVVHATLADGQVLAQQVDLPYVHTP